MDCRPWNKTEKFEGTAWPAGALGGLSSFASGPLASAFWASLLLTSLFLTCLLAPFAVSGICAVGSEPAFLLVSPPSREMKALSSPLLEEDIRLEAEGAGLIGSLMAGWII